MVKIELGVHSDGYPVLLAYSIVIGGDAKDPLLLAAHQILQVHLKKSRLVLTPIDAAKKINSSSLDLM